MENFDLINEMSRIQVSPYLLLFISVGVIICLFAGLILLWFRKRYFKRFNEWQTGEINEYHNNIGNLFTERTELKKSVATLDAQDKDNIAKINKLTSDLTFEQARNNNLQTEVNNGRERYAAKVNELSELSERFKASEILQAHQLEIIEKHITFQKDISEHKEQTKPDNSVCRKIRHTATDDKAEPIIDLFKYKEVNFNNLDKTDEVVSNPVQDIQQILSEIRAELSGKLFRLKGRGGTTFSLLNDKLIDIDGVIWGYTKKGKEICLYDCGKLYKICSEPK